jgi:hypothetical protein
MSKSTKKVEVVEAEQFTQAELEAAVRRAETSKARRAEYGKRPEVKARMREYRTARYERQRELLAKAREMGLLGSGK